MIIDVGGIDMNNIEVDRQGEGMNIEFDPVALDPLFNEQIKGFTPIIINMVPLPSIMPLLGLVDTEESEMQITKLKSPYVAENRISQFDVVSE